MHRELHPLAFRLRGLTNGYEPIDPRPIKDTLTC